MTFRLRTSLGAVAVLSASLTGCNRAPYALLPRTPSYPVHVATSATVTTSQASKPDAATVAAASPSALGAGRRAVKSAPLAPAPSQTSRPSARRLVQELRQTARAAAPRLRPRHHDAAQRNHVVQAPHKTSGVGHVLLAILGIGLAVLSLIVALAALFGGSIGWLIASLLVFVLGIVLAVRSFGKME